MIFKVYSSALGSLAGDMCVGGEAAAGLMQWLFSRVWDEIVASVLTPQILGKQVFSFQVRWGCVQFGTQNPCWGLLYVGRWHAQRPCGVAAGATALLFLPRTAAQWGSYPDDVHVGVVATNRWVLHTHHKHRMLLKSSASTPRSRCSTLLTCATASSPDSIRQPPSPPCLWTARWVGVGKIVGSV